VRVHTVTAEALPRLSEWMVRLERPTAFYLLQGARPGRVPHLVRPTDKVAHATLHDDEERRGDEDEERVGDDDGGVGDDD